MKQKLAKMTVLTALMLAIMLTLTFCDYRTDFEKALGYEADGDYEQAISLYTKAIKASPSVFHIYANRSNAYLEIKQYDKALADHNKMIELSPNAYGVYSGRGSTYALMGEYDKAIADFSKAIAFKPEYADAYYYRAKAYEAIGKVDLAEADRDKAKELEQTKKQPNLYPHG